MSRFRKPRSARAAGSSGHSTEARGSNVAGRSFGSPTRKRGMESSLACASGSLVSLGIAAAGRRADSWAIRDQRRRRLQARLAEEIAAGAEDEFAFRLQAAATGKVVVRPAVALVFEPGA